MFQPGCWQGIQLYVGARRSGLGFGQLRGLCTAWEFAFSAPEAYLIEDGRLTRPLTGVTLSGNGPATPAGVDAVGPDLAFTQALCGKEDQWVARTEASPRGAP
jgi:predicted Zn-dependent protease